ncbi:hypothetical protein ACN38_g10571 [Penicillium nordicum]|uniref:Uncharacterized protein n=1 Tax=Penicillium nordicum TaxID=229535 RepID=A0A0M8NSM8_9EURO|nr:hypothetical protein ACN38_g10571 [Penicillium nordicum]
MVPFNSFNSNRGSNIYIYYKQYRGTLNPRLEHPAPLIYMPRYSTSDSTDAQGRSISCPGRTLEDSSPECRNRQLKNSAI